MSKLRRATHAGSWYTGNGGELNDELSHWLSEAALVQSPARAVIVPHAGYYYSGSCAGHAYRQVEPTKVRRVFILGPAHHVHLTSCALSSTQTYKTPLYDLNIDTQVYNELYATGLFEEMSISTDEDEHSIEMQLPYIAKVMESRRGQFTIVPVLVGSLTLDREQAYGQVFAKYLANADNLFVISSDFCHWGQRFKYTYYNKAHGEIWQSIEQLDRMGMDLIESMNHVAFNDYLKQYHNTICGRHPIGILLGMLAVIRQNGNGHQFALRFVKYAQSSRCSTMKDSSVSYAAASLTIK
jgi:hypothetical protein